MLPSMYTALACLACAAFLRLVFRATHSVSAHAALWQVLQAGLIIWLFALPFFTQSTLEPYSAALLLSALLALLRPIHPFRAAEGVLGIYAAALMAEALVALGNGSLGADAEAAGFARDAAVVAAVNVVLVTFFCALQRRRVPDTSVRAPVGAQPPVRRAPRAHGELSSLARMYAAGTLSEAAFRRASQRLRRTGGTEQLAS